MAEEHVVLSERLEDQLKAVEWAREQKKKIRDDKNKHIADKLIAKTMAFNVEGRRFTTEPFSVKNM